MAWEARWEVYALVDPRDSLVKYIGRTFLGSGRYYGHLRRVDEGPPARRRWLATLKRAGRKPQITILDWTHSFGGIRRAENVWINRGRVLGWPLKNSRGGGGGGVPRELRERLRDFRDRLRARRKK